MSEHPNANTINRMTRAVFEEDKDTLNEVLSPDLLFHLRGPYEHAGDHDGVSGFLDALGSIFEATGGDIELDTRFVLADDRWGAEWETAELRRDGKVLESKNAFVYRFQDGRIAEMWMYLGADADEAEAFFA